ncbi:MAG: arginine repressor [Ruminococcaceae bacterium]|nr:arginine repressor [Oscillospiraceae bacterium]
MKSERQARILELITKFEIETQDDMMNRLREEGFAVTQATVSRDLRELQLTKSLTARGTYRYSVSASKNHIRNNAKLSSAMADSITGVEYSLNNVVIKTYPGMAQAVASGIDAMNMHDILGSVAGDDTIIIITKNTESSEQIRSRILEIMKSF